MDKKERFSALLSEFGAIIGIESLQLDEEMGCTLGFDDQVINLSYIEKDHSLMVFSNLGSPPDENRAALFQKLLAANLYRDQMMNAALSYHAPTNRIVLVLHQSLDGMTLGKFDELMQRFIDLAESWNRNISGNCTEPSPNTAGGDNGDTSWLRV